MSDAFNKSIMAVAKNVGDFYASVMDMEINKWFMQEFGRLPDMQTIQEKAALAYHYPDDRHENGSLKGTVFAWDGKCIMNFVSAPESGSMHIGKVPHDFVRIIPKNVLT